MNLYINENYSTVGLVLKIGLYEITEIKGDWINIECLSDLLTYTDDKSGSWTIWIEGN